MAAGQLAAQTGVEYNVWRRTVKPKSSTDRAAWCFSLAFSHVCDSL